MATRLVLMHIPEYGKIKGTSVHLSSIYSNKCFTVCWPVAQIKMLQDAKEVRPQSVVLAAVREGNLTSPPGNPDTQQPAWTSPLFRSTGSQCLWGLAM